MNEQYTPGATTKPSKNFRHLSSKVRQNVKDCAITVTAEQVKLAIRPDDISHIMLKHSGPTALNYLANLPGHSPPSVEGG